MNSNKHLTALRRGHAAGALGLVALACGFALAPVAAAAADATLTGWANLPADTFAPGPTSGQFITPNNGITPPFIDKQPVQGFSAVLQGPVAGSYYVMPDNGFGTKANSADAMLRMYAVSPDFKTATGGTGTVSAVNYTSGAKQSGFNAGTYISLRDPNQLLGFPIVASMTNYPGSKVSSEAAHGEMINPANSLRFGDVWRYVLTK